jgi:CheY-like chemotaxis protein
MLVEDDKSLREIYSIRLVAEGYNIVSAGDGEEALALAVQEKPELIIADVMMPKISGFDMLDILRSQPETNKIKVIMMTALSSDDQRQRGEALGAERYLVKSQVGIEDVIATVHEVLGDEPNASAQANLDTAAAMPAVETAIKDMEKSNPAAATAAPAPAEQIIPDTPAPAPVEPPMPTAAPTPESAPMAAPIEAPAPVEQTMPETPAPAQAPTAEAQPTQSTNIADQNSLPTNF